MPSVNVGIVLLTPNRRYDGLCFKQKRMDTVLQNFLRRLFIPATAVLVAACGGSSGGDGNNDAVIRDDGSGSTTIPGQIINQSPEDAAELQRELEWLHGKMKTEYLFYDETPDVDYTQFESADALLQRMIVSEKDRFSYMQPLEEAINDSNGVSTSFGMRVESSEDIFQVARVYDSSSASEAGIERADRIIRIGDVSIVDSDSIDRAWEVARNAENGATLEFEFVRDGNTRSFIKELTRTEVSRQTVDFAGYITEPDGTQTGYIYVYQYLQKTQDELRQAFRFFQDNDITSLIIDLRDNQGGSIEAINVFASLILSDKPPGSSFIRFQFSDLGDAIFRNGEFTTGYDLAVEPDAAAIQRVHVISSGRTCSASEVLVNSLRAYMDVQITGDTTCGKPYGFYWRQFEEKSVLWAINFTSANARGEDDFANGLAPTCDISEYEIYPFADTRDLHLATALNYLKSNTCQLPDANSEPRVKSHSGTPVFNLVWQRDPKVDSL